MVTNKRTNDQPGDPRASLLLTNVQMYSGLDVIVIEKGIKMLLKKPYRQNLYMGESVWQQVEREGHFRLFKAIFYP